MAPRPKKEYEERESDSTGTPLQRFERALKKVLSTPKEKIQQPPREGGKQVSA